MKCSLIFPVVALVGSALATAGEYTTTKLPVATAPGPAAANSVVIDLNSVKATLKVERSFYGSQVSNDEPVPDDGLMDDLQLGAVRIGGNFYDNYNWENNLFFKEGMGIWPGVPTSLEDFVSYFTAHDVDSIIQVNLMGAAPEYHPELKPKEAPGESLDHYPLNKKWGTPSKAAGLVTFLNQENNYKIVNFSVGNEPEQWHETNQVSFGKEAISADQYIERYVSYALAMRAAQEAASGNANDIKLWGPEISDGHYDWQSGQIGNAKADGKDCWWEGPTGQIRCAYGPTKSITQFVPYFLSKLAQIEKDKARNPKGYKLLDYFAFHYYPNFRTDPSKKNAYLKNAAGAIDVDKMLEHTEIWDNPNFENTADISSYRAGTKPSILPRMNKWIADNYPNAKLALSEFAVDSYDSTFGYPAMVRPLYMADTIGRLARNGVSFFSRAFLSSKEAKSIPWVLIDGGVHSDISKMYQLFTKNFKGNVLQVSEKTDKMVKAYAVLDADKVVNLIVVNKSRKAQPLSIALKQADGTIKPILNGVSQPGWSARLYKLSPTWTEVVTQTFGAAEMGVAIQ